MADPRASGASASLSLSLDPIYPTAQKIEGFAVDSVVSTNGVGITQIRKGVDGFVAMNTVPSVYELTITLISTSPSISFFNNWFNNLNTLNSPLICNGTLTLGDIGKRYKLIQGTLTDYPVIPPVTNQIGDISYTITFSLISPEDI